MFRKIQRYFDSQIRRPEGVTSIEADDARLRLATAALLIEVSRADHRIDDSERSAINHALKKTFGLSADETSELVELAEREVKESVSSYEFTRLINKGFSYERKRHVVELLWQVVFADSEMERHEEHLVRRIADLIHVSHKDFIEAKIKARAESAGGAG